MSARKRGRSKEEMKQKELDLEQLPDFNENEINEIKEAFDLFDVKGDGFVDLGLVKSYLSQLGVDQKYSMIWNMICQLEKQMKGGVVNFVDFINSLQWKLGDTKTGSGLKRVFDLLDFDGSGILDGTDLKKVANEIGENMTEEEIQELITDFYNCPNGTIKVDEFYKMMIKDTF